MQHIYIDMTTIHTSSLKKKYPQKFQRMFFQMTVENTQEVDIHEAINYIHRLIQTFQNPQNRRTSQDCKILFGRVNFEKI